LRRADRTGEAERLSGATFKDPERAGTNWTYRLQDGEFSIERRAAAEVERFPIDYALGSGHHAVTFVTLTNRTPDRPTMLEHRLTVFTDRQAPDITPGQGEAQALKKPGIGASGRRFESAETLKCFECHTTTRSDRGPEVLDERTMLPNVGCENCHGPGQRHVHAAETGAHEATLTMPFGAGGWTAEQEIRLCGACHRLPETVDPALIRPENPTLVRFQPVGLMQSACYKKSKGRLSCATCHDPHARTSTDTAAYESVCLSCHQGPTRTVCQVSPSSGCVGCHMPRRDASRGMMMVDHWIRSRP
jgi:hypothetical protein